MTIAENLSFGSGAKLPLILQTEAAECGLACLAMVGSYYGYRTGLRELRQRFPVSLKGATLGGLINVATQLELNTRPLKLDMEHLEKLRMPCILHWNFNHFVVLKSVGASRIAILDPGIGERALTFDQVSRSFTGVALELWPTNQFKSTDERRGLRLQELVGRLSGVVASCMQILLLALALEIFALVAPFFLQWVIDNVIVTADRDLLATLAIGFGLLMILHQAVFALRAWVLLYVGTTLNLQWRANVFAHLIRLPVQYFEKRHLGDIVSRFGSIDLIQRSLTTTFLEAVLDGLMTVVTLALMFMYSPMLAGVAVATMVIYALSRLVWYGPLKQVTEEQIIHAARQQSHFLETVRGVKAIKLFQRQEDRRTTWLTLVVEQVNAEVRTQRMQLFYKVLNGVLFGGENILIIWLGAKLVLDGNFSVGVLIAFNAYKGQFDARVCALIDKYFDLKMLQVQGERLADIVLTRPEEFDERFSSFDDGPLAPSIVVKNLRFRYGEQEPYILDGINFAIEAGESVAIAGPSGCGKTTLINVLLGILPPTEGEILIGGIPLKQVGVTRLRRVVGTVMQDDSLFAGSIEENISFFDPQVNRAWVLECAQRAAIATDIAAMPMAFNTLVGDMGTVLSGGQKQRILLARALYKRPNFLFMDEATSHLDTACEREVNASISVLNITRVIVAHRAETIASAQRVIVLMGGRVATDSRVVAKEPGAKRPVDG